MRRLFVDSLTNLNEGNITITGDDAKHLLYAMRVRPEQEFTLVDKEKKVASAKVISYTNGKATMQFLNYVVDGNTVPPRLVILAQCLPKGDKMDYIVQKAVELGVYAIVPVVSKHCVVKYDDKKRKARKVKWQKIADEATKQSGRTYQPQIGDIINLADLVKAYPEFTCLACYEAEEQQSLAQILTSETNDKFLILIGPEGGFAPEEIDLCKANNFASVSLGPRILRTETASLAALSILMYTKGDM